jgi:DNA-binding LytR/AlgR family response regulator
VRPRYLIGVLLATLRRLLAPGDAADLRDRPEAEEELLKNREADVVMPELGGPELAARLTAAQPSLKVVYMTGYAERAVAGELAPWPLLQKPFDVGALADTIREVLDDDAPAGSADPLPLTQP